MVVADKRMHDVVGGERVGRLRVLCFGDEGSDEMCVSMHQSVALWTGGHNTLDLETFSTAQREQGPSCCAVSVFIAFGLWDEVSRGKKGDR